MGRIRETTLQIKRAERVLELGTLTIMVRPRMTDHIPGELGDVQRMLLILQPSSQEIHRVIAVGRKRLLRSASQERFWGFVDLVLYDRRDLKSALDAQTFGAKSMEMRHLPAARVAARGQYAFVGYEGETFLEYTLDQIDERDPEVGELRLSGGQNLLVTVANPDPTVWGLEVAPPIQTQLFPEEEIHATVPAQFPAHLQSRFGNRKSVPVDTVDWLNHPGTELIFVAVPSPPD